MSWLNGCKNQFVIFALLTKPCYVKKIYVTATSKVTYNLSQILCTLRSKIKPLPKKINVHNHVDKSESIFSKGKYSKLTLKTAELFMYISNIHVIVHYWILNNELPVFFCKFVQVNFHVLLLHYICMHDRPTVNHQRLVKLCQAVPARHVWLIPSRWCITAYMNHTHFNEKYT